MSAVGTQWRCEKAGNGYFLDNINTHCIRAPEGDSWCVAPGQKVSKGVGFLFLLTYSSGFFKRSYYIKLKLTHARLCFKVNDQENTLILWLFDG